MARKPSSSLLVHAALLLPSHTPLLNPADKRNAKCRCNRHHLQKPHRGNPTAASIPELSWFPTHPRCNANAASKGGEWARVLCEAGACPPCRDHARAGRAKTDLGRLRLPGGSKTLRSRKDTGADGQIAHSACSDAIFPVFARRARWFQDGNRTRPARLIRRGAAQHRKRVVNRFATARP